MPPGRGRGRGRGGMQFARATLVSVLNSSAETDEEARKRVFNIFLPLLVITFLLDITCSCAMIYIKCYDGDSSDDAALMICTREDLKRGISFPLFLEEDDVLGDMVWLALIRTVLTTMLLIIVMRCGGTRGRANASRIIASEEGETHQETSSLSTPLLNNDDNTNAIDDSFQNENQEATPDSSRHETKKYSCSFLTVKSSVYIILFMTSIFYQVYAGLKVVIYPQDQNPHLPPLMCLTILWINTTSYFFGVIVEELTREKGLFLTAEVHRHPVFYEESRGVSMHWCDLCRQRIKPINNRRVGEVDAEEGRELMGCYRCSLCDFDICHKCALRSDAATVGENMLRGDHGVRAETVIDNKSYFRRTLRIIKSEITLLFMSLLLLVAASMMKLLLPHFQGHIIDKVIPGDDGKFDKTGFSHYIKLYIYLMLAQGAVSTAYSAIFTLVSRRLKFSIRNSLFERILSQDVAYFDGTESGRLISLLTNDLDLMMSPIQSSLSSLLNNILILIGGMAMCFIHSYRLSMLALVTAGPISYLWGLYAEWSKGLAREMLSYWAEGNSIASQALSHVRTVKAFGCEDRVISKYSEANKHALDCGVKDAWGNGLTSALTGYLDLGSGVLILYFGGLLVYKGEMSVGELVTFQLFWNMMNNAYQNLQGLVTSFTRSAAGAEKVFSMWESKPDIDPNKGLDVSWDVNGDLELCNVQFFYQMRPDNIVLENFNLSIPAGKTLALVGRSGGGKSTIINLLLRFYDAKQGRLLLDGKPYKNIKVNQLRRLFGVVTQDTELFSLTIEENIAYGLSKSDYTQEDLIQAAKKAQAYDFILQMKDGFQTRIGERGNRISGGQRQRIAIARVFLRKPKIILLDEATSALDEHSQEAVQKALSVLITESHATVVLVAHRLSTVMNAHSIVVIDNGRVLEQGTHNELVVQDGIYASMVQKQNKKLTDELDQKDKIDIGDL